MGVQWEDSPASVGFEVEWVGDRESRMGKRKKGLFCPPGWIWQGTETFLVAVTWEEGLLASKGWGPGVPPDTLP